MIKRSILAVFIVTVFILLAGCDLIPGCDLMPSEPGKMTMPAPSKTTTSAPTSTAPTKTDLSKLKVIETKSQDITASGGSVNLGNDIAVTVPAGVLSTTKKLTINKLDPSNLALATGTNQQRGVADLAGYEINLGDMKQFNLPVAIQMAYDPAKIDSDLPPEKALLAAYWDTEENAWETVPVHVDTAKKTVDIYTDHLTIWKLSHIMRGYKIYESDHFIVVYDPKKSVKVGVEMDVTAKGTATPTTKVVTQEQDALGFAQRVATYAEESYKAYMKANFKDPRYTSIHAIEALSWPIGLPVSKVYIFIWGDPESETYSMIGNIKLANNYDNFERVKHEVAHELFHAVEQRYFTIWGYGLRQWWLEACADYAADRIAWGGLNSMEDISLDYFGKPINTVDKRHEYQTARFLDYLARKNVDFKGLFDAVAAGYTQIMGSFADYVMKKSTATLHDNYKGFVAYALFDSTSPLQPLSTALSASSLNTGRPTYMLASTRELSYTLDLKGNYTSGIWAFKVGQSQLNKPRSIKVEITGNAPPAADVDADIYVLKNDKRVSGGVTADPSIYRGTINANKKSASLTVSDVDMIYIVGFNTGNSDQSLALKVSDDVSGTWTQVSKKVTLSPTAPVTTPAYSARSASGGDGSASLTSGNFKWVTTWTEPPSTLKPGQKWTGTIAVSDAGSNTKSADLGTCSIRIELGDKYTSVIAQRPVGHPAGIKEFMTLQDSRPFSFDIPGLPQNTLTITVVSSARYQLSTGDVVTSATSRVTVEYKYELR